MTRPAQRKRPPAKRREQPSEAQIAAEIERAMKVEGAFICRAKAIENISWERKRAASKKE